MWSRHLLSAVVAVGCLATGPAVDAAASAAGESPVTVATAPRSPPTTADAPLDWARDNRDSVLSAAAHFTIQDNLPAAVLLSRATAARLDVRSSDSTRRSAAESVLCRAHYRLKNRKEAVEACGWAVSLARAANSPRALAIALRMSALLAIEAEDPATAAASLREGKLAAEKANDAAMVAVTVNTLGIAAEAAGITTEATRHYAEAFKLATDAKEPGVAVLAATNLGMLHIANRQPGAALLRAISGLPLAKAAKNTQIAFVLQAIEAQSLVQLGRAKEAQTLLERIMQAAANADARVLGHLYVALAETQLAMKDNAAALVSARHGVELVHNSAVRRAFAELTLADALVANGKTNDALVLLKNIDAANNTLAGARADAFARTGDLLLNRGEVKEGARFLQLALEAHTRLQADQAREQLAFLSTQLDADRREREMASLRDREAAAEAQSRQVTTQRNAALLVAVLALLAGFGWWRSRRFERQRARLAVELANQQQALQVQTTKQATLERELDHKRRLEALGRLTAGVSKDFNTLINMVQQATIRLRNRPGVAADPIAAALVDEAGEAARTGADLAYQLMSFGRRQNLNPVRLEMPAFLEANVALLENAAGEAQLELEVASDVPAVVADRSGLVTALINLVANARHAIEVRRGSEGAANGPAGTGFSSTIGHIRIAATAVEVVGADEHWPLLPPGTYVAVAVEDNGCGMPAGVLAQAVEPFFTTRLPGEGSGLGLSMVQGFARQTGGDLRLVSQAGEGTTVTLLLPSINSILPPCSN